MANPWLTQGQMRLLELYPPVATQGNLTFGFSAPHAGGEAPPPGPPPPPPPALGARLTREQHRALLQRRIRDVLDACSAHLAKAALQRRSLATYATRELAARAAPTTAAAAAAATDAHVPPSFPYDDAPGAFLALQPSPPQSGLHQTPSFCRHDTSKAAPAYGEAPGGACSEQVYGLSGEPSFRRATGRRMTTTSGQHRPATPEYAAGRAGSVAAAAMPPPPPPSSDEVDLVARRLEAAGVPGDLARQAAVLQADVQRARCAVAHDVERLRRLDNAAAAASRSRRGSGTTPSFVPRRRPTTTSFARQPASRSRSHSQRQRRRSTVASFASSATDDAAPTRGDAHRRARRRQSSAAPPGSDAAATSAAAARRESRASGRRASRAPVQAASRQRRRTRSRASRVTLTEEGVRRRRSRKGTKESAGGGEAADDNDDDDDDEGDGGGGRSSDSCSGDDSPTHISSTAVLGTMYQKAALVRSKLKENKFAAVQAAAASAGASGAGLIEWGRAESFEHLAVAARVAALREHQHAVLDDIVDLVGAEAQRVEKAYHEAVERVVRRGRKVMQQQQPAAAGAGTDSGADPAGHAKREQALQEGLKLACVKEFTLDMMKTGRYVDPDVLDARVDKLEEGIGTLRASNERQTRLVEELDEEVKTLTYMVDALSDEHKDVLLSEYSRQVLRDSRAKKATVEVQCDIRVVDYEVETKAKAIVRRECLLRSELGIFKATLANVAAFKKVIASDLTCRACFDSFVAPVTLHPCGHSVCSRCVSDLCVDDAQGLKCADCGSMSHQQPRRNHALRGLVAKWFGASSPLTKVDAVLSQSAAEVEAIEATLQELDEWLEAAAGAGVVG